MQVQMSYDQNMMIMQQQQQHHQHQQHQHYSQHYDGGHKSRSNSLTHQSEFTPKSNSTNNNVNTTTITSPSSTASPKVVDLTPSVDNTQPLIEENHKSSVDNINEVTANLNSLNLTTTTTTVATPTTIEDVSVQNGERSDEVKIDGDGWARAKALEINDKQPAEVISQDVGLSPWKRGISMSEKTPAQMLLRQDGIKRYGRETIISVHIFGANPVPDIVFSLYGHKLTSNERGECKPLTGPAPKSPNKGRRENKRREEAAAEEHPDEKNFFVAKNDSVFR